MQRRGADDPSSTVLVDSWRVGVWRFGSPGGWPLVWNHGGLSCGMDATVMDEAARSRGAEIIAIDRPGIGRSDLWSMGLIGQWGHTVAQVADYCISMISQSPAGQAGAPTRSRALRRCRSEYARSTVAGMAPLERLRHVFEIGFVPDELLIPAARWTPWVAAALLRLIRRVPPRVVGCVLPHLAGRRMGQHSSGLPVSLMATHREVMRSGVQGMVGEYRRYYGSWGFDPRDVQQSVTIWQGEEDTLVPMKHARRLASLLPNGTLTTVPSTGHLLPVVMANEILDDLAPMPHRKSAQTSS